MIEVRDDLCPLCLEEIKPGEPLVYSGATGVHKRCYESEIGESAPLKDDYRVQRHRIERLIREMQPSVNIHWDEDRVPTFIWLRVDDSITGAILVVSSGDWHVSQIADKSDAEVKQLISAWSGGKLR